MKTFLITGGAGFFGGIMKDFLKNSGGGGVKIVSVDLVETDEKSQGLECVRGDIRNERLLEDIFSRYKFDAIFHFASLLAHVKKTLGDLWDSNVRGTKVLLDAAIKHNVKTLVFTSSNCLWGKNFDSPVSEEEVPEPIEIYGKSKLECERILLSKKDEINSVIIRCPTIMDEGRLGLLAILYEFIDEGRKIPMVGDGKNVYQFIYAKDLAKACVLALDYKKSGVFNIGSDNVKTFNETYEYVIKKSGSASRLWHLPKWLLTFLMKACFALGVSPLGPYQYKMISSSFVFDTKKIKRELGFEPTLTNEEMMLKSYEYYHKNRAEIEGRKNVSAHKQAAKMGAIRILKWLC